MAKNQDFMVWRWDQGRSQYFKFEAIQNIAKVLTEYNGSNMSLVNDTFRKDLEKASGLPFSPSNYTIKRNYKRVFECSLLATYIGNRLIASDICREIANNSILLSTPDAYLYELERRFRYPFPAFNNYKEFRGICFPFFAIIKFMLARILCNRNEKTSSLSLQEIGSFLIANCVTGLEDLEFYKKLRPKEFNFDSFFSNDQKRQVREMMALLGQHSYISYNKNTLILCDISDDECMSAFYSMIPITTKIGTTNPIDDFLQLTRYEEKQHPTVRGEYEDAASLEDFYVKEGKKVFASHIKTERDTSLRKEYIRLHPNPVCDVCGEDMHVTYPWTENMLEIHHLKPLSSYDKEHKTSIKDVVGVCPSCHRAIHIYHRKYLKLYNKQDFDDSSEALFVYNEAKSKVRKINRN